MYFILLYFLSLYYNSTVQAIQSMTLQRKCVFYTAPAKVRISLLLTIRQIQSKVHVLNVDIFLLDPPTQPTVASTVTTERPTTTVASTTTTTRSSTTSSPTPPGFVCPESNGFFPNPEMPCSASYYTCISGISYLSVSLCNFPAHSVLL